MTQPQISQEQMIAERICPKVIRNMTPDEIKSGKFVEVQIRLPTKKEIADGVANWGEYVAEVWITKIFKVRLNIKQSDFVFILSGWGVEEITIDKPAVCDCPVQYTIATNRKCVGSKYYKMTIILSLKYRKIYDYDFPTSIGRLIKGEPSLDSLFEMPQSVWNLLNKKGELKL